MQSSTFSVLADTETLLRQAPMTALDYMMHALRDIDELLGEGYAKAHPELIGAYMQTAAIDFGTAVIARALESIDRSISEGAMMAGGDSSLSC